MSILAQDYSNYDFGSKVGDVNILNIQRFARSITIPDPIP
jgi:hypothetical protein